MRADVACPLLALTPLPTNTHFNRVLDINLLSRRGTFEQKLKTHAPAPMHGLSCPDKSAGLVASTWPLPTYKLNSNLVFVMDQAYANFQSRSINTY